MFTWKQQKINAMFWFLLQYSRMLSNFHAEQPHRHAVYYTSVLVAEQAWTKLDLAQCMDGKLA